MIPCSVYSPAEARVHEKARTRGGVFGEIRQKKTWAESSKRKGQKRGGLAPLSQSVSKAVSTLVGLLDTGDGRLKRLAAKDILDEHAKLRELDELTRRISAIEERLEARG
jgi:hypothetical protein